MLFLTVVEIARMFLVTYNHLFDWLSEDESASPPSSSH